MNKKGIDVSKWQGAIDWEKVKQDGVDFAIIREGYGKENPNQVDKRFEENYKKAKAAGISVGVYHYSYADSVEDAKLEAEFCLKNIAGKQLEYPVVFDIEDKEQLKLTNQQRTELCKAFCETIEKAGYYAMIYCNLNWWNNYLNCKELGKYDLWLAHWDVAKPAVSCGIWQKSERGIIDGINGNVDLNESFKDYPSIMKQKGLNGFASNSQSSSTASNDTTTKPTYINYIIENGDTLSAIAKRYNTTVSKLAEINAIKDVNKIYMGQLLRVPISQINGNTPVFYTVKPGDTLSAIALKYGTTVNKLVSDNGIKDKNKIYVGQPIKVK